jgi:glycosyltransferase involved in cell wall biosynthesis
MLKIGIVRYHKNIRSGELVMPKIAVLIPCYNESMTIEKVIKDYANAIPEADIYVYDNNSTDNTADIAQKAGAIVRYERRQGKGNVMRTMFREIDADCYLIVDGDDTYSAEDARMMVNLVLSENADMVIGDRLSSTYFTENKRLFHNTGNRLVRFLINKIFQSNIKDIMTGYRAFSKVFVKNYPVISKGFEIETEMTIHALDKNFNIREVPITYKDRPEGSNSKLNTFSDGFKVLKTIARLFRDYKPYAFFTLIAAIGILFATILFIPILLEFLNTGIVPRFPTLIVAVTIYIISILMWICGIILEVIVNKHRQLYEILLNKN